MLFAVLLVCVCNFVCTRQKGWWICATISMLLIVFYIPFKHPGILLCHTITFYEHNSLPRPDADPVWLAQTGPMLEGKWIWGHFKWPVLSLGTLKGWGWPFAALLACSLRFRKKLTGREEESPPKAVLKLHMTRQRQRRKAVKKISS